MRQNWLYKVAESQYNRGQGSQAVLCALRCGFPGCVKVRQRQSRFLGAASIKLAAKADGADSENTPGLLRAQMRLKRYIVSVSVRTRVAGEGNGADVPDHLVLVDPANARGAVRTSYQN